MHCISCIILHIFLAFIMHIQVPYPAFYFNIKLTHHYNTRANFKKKMDNLEPENSELREEVTALKADLANLTTLMEALVVAQNQPPSVQPQPTRVNAKVPAVSVSATLTVVQNRMPQGYPWGILENFSREGFNLGP